MSARHKITPYKRWMLSRTNGNKRRLTPSANVAEASSAAEMSEQGKKIDSRTRVHELLIQADFALDKRRTMRKQLCSNAIPLLAETNNWRPARALRWIVPAEVILITVHSARRSLTSCCSYCLTTHSLRH